MKFLNIDGVTRMWSAFKTHLSTKADQDTTYTKNQVDTALNLKSDKSTTYTKTEVDSLISAVFKYKGTKATVAEVQALTTKAVGDVWFVTADQSEYAWNGTKWEKLGPTIDMSPYITGLTIAGLSLNVSNNSITAAQLVNALNAKTKQTAVTDPTASGTATQFISGITQDANGVITPTKKSVDFSSYVPTTRKINSKALSSDVTLSASDVGAVPTTRKVNNKALSSDITLGGGDIVSGQVTSGNTVNQDLSALSTNIGSVSSALNSRVPTPTSGDAGKFLRGDGTWAEAGSVKSVNSQTPDNTGDIALSGANIPSSAITGAANVDAGLSALSGQIGDLADGLAYVENGNTASRNYSKGQYILWKDDLYKVKTATINSGATFTAGTNVEDVGDQGGLNELNDLNLTDTLAYASVSTSATTLNLIEGRKLSDYKLLMLVAFDNQTACGSTFLSQSSFANGYMIQVYGYSLAPYNGVVRCNRVSDTSVQMVATQLNGWTTMHCILYGFK